MIIRQTQRSWCLMINYILNFNHQTMVRNIKKFFWRTQPRYMLQPYSFIFKPHTTMFRIVTQNFEHFCLQVRLTKTVLHIILGKTTGNYLDTSMLLMALSRIGLSIPDHCLQKRQGQAWRLSAIGQIKNTKSRQKAQTDHICVYTSMSLQLAGLQLTKFRHLLALSLKQRQIFFRGTPLTKDCA